MQRERVRSKWAKKNDGQEEAEETCPKTEDTIYFSKKKQKTK